ncbi:MULTISPECIES: ABC transporter family substrate-binding protein [Brachybacterium]|uniref:ABC transporter family substrate-binding protein n=2 Tax=Dermabacteraceae TaxID=85020 RepID=UPI000DF1D4A3|nr:MULTISPECIES: ABC transporter family substrate-binding protein [Brachybacterium]RCS63612.1 ABC transporter family substrate-binding protein [Brachybacterium sp. JB7]RCS69394.1 ABC transporter family substrate-binding protein [Brachybacterium alimentarium]RCS71394.1 ABC transporter family substrate-binding protein [Brachybacterium alimentarium]RCS80608.1 ABC transporter family substrate-binding protein [Brachybacterium alimentarium]RCS82791.1 ABC transporter family substrate-binding protein 
MRLTRRSMLGATAMTVSMTALAACSKDPGNGGSGGSDGGGGEQIASDANDINAKERDELGEGGVLRLANNAFPANWNPNHTDGNEGNTTEMLEAIFPVLTLSDAAGVVGPNPSYTKRVELTSEDPQVMEIELNEGMTWSDGTPIDYKSIENVFKVMDGSQEEYGIASSEGYNQVEKIEQGDDDLTAVITFKEKYADWLGLASVMPDALVESADAFNTGWLEEPLVTAGPYKVGKIDAGNKTVLLEPDENWWGDKALLDQVLFTTIEDPSATATSFQNGQLDVIETTVPATYSVVEPMIGDGVVLREAAGPNWSHITLNGTEGRPLADPALRQAVFRAIDREEVFLSVNSTMPYPDDTEPLNNHLLMTNQEGYQDNSGDFGSYDPDAAKKLLEDAGYTFEDDLATKDGEPIEITYVYNDGSKTNEAVVPVVQEQLAAVGITMKVQKVPPTDLFSKYVIPGEFDLTLFGWLGTPYLSSGDAIWKSTGEQNFGKVGNDETDELIEQAAVETDEAARLDLINQIDANLWELAGTLPLWQSYDFFVQNEDLANYGAKGFQTPDWTKIGYVEGSAKLDG